LLLYHFNGTLIAIETDEGFLRFAELLQAINYFMTLEEVA